MRRYIAVLLILLLALGSTSRLVAAAKITGAIAGVARTTAGLALSNQVVRVRSMQTGALIDTTTTSVNGSFNVANLSPGRYLVEIVNSAGWTVGASTIATVVEGGTAPVMITAASATSVTAQGGGNRTLLIILLVAGGALGIWGLTKAFGDDDGSPSS